MIVLFYILLRKEFGKYLSLQGLLGNYQCLLYWTFFFFFSLNVDEMFLYKKWLINCISLLHQWPDSGTLRPAESTSLSLLSSAVRSDKAAQGFTNSSHKNPQGWPLPKHSEALFHSLAVLRVIFSVYPVQTSFLSVYICCLLSSCHVWLPRTGLCLLNEYPVGAGGCC